MSLQYDWSNTPFLHFSFKETYREQNHHSTFCKILANAPLPSRLKIRLGASSEYTNRQQTTHQWCLIYQGSTSDHRGTLPYLHQSSRLQERDKILRLGEVWLELLAKHLQLIPDIVVACNLILPWNMQLVQCILTSLCLCHKQEKIKLVSDKT
jgi:hypothetical protein